MYEQKRPTVMLVDDNMVNLDIGKNILREFYEIFALPSAERLFTFLERVMPDIILLDVEMPGLGGFDVIKILKAHVKWSSIPVIFVTSRTAEADELEGLMLGAADYITKPFSAAILLKRISNQLVIQKQREALNSFNENLMKMINSKSNQISKLQHSIISTIADMVEFRDYTTGGHISRTHQYMQTLLSQMIASDIYTAEVFAWGNLDNMLLSAQLHDVGKLAISDAILNKPGQLTTEEFEIMKSHTTKGVEIIEQMEMKNGDHDFLAQAKIMAGTHHEKWDGSGYPYGLSGLAIPLEGRIMAIADVYDALTSDRPYKKPLSSDEAASIIIDRAGTHFDPDLINIFKQVECDFVGILM